MVLANIKCQSGINIETVLTKQALYVDYEGTFQHEKKNPTKMLASSEGISEAFKALRV